LDFRRLTGAVSGGEHHQTPPKSGAHPLRVCRKKDFLCVTLWNLRASVVKLLREINHRGTEIAQRTTEFGFPDRLLSGDVTASCSKLVVREEDKTVETVS